MENDIKTRNSEYILTSKDNIILKVSRKFLGLIGYTEGDLIGKTLMEISKLLRVDSQVELQVIDGDTEIFIFTKKLHPIEGTISCEMTNYGTQKVFSFKEDPFNAVSQNFNFANQLATSRGDGVVMFSASKMLLINSNQAFLDFVQSPYNQSKNSMGKRIIEIFTQESCQLMDEMKTCVMNTGKVYCCEEIGINISHLGQTYWNVTFVPISDGEKIKYFILYLSNETEKVLNKKENIQSNQNLEMIIENMSDDIIIFDKDLNVKIFNKKIEKNLTKSDPSVMNLNKMSDFKKNTLIFDDENHLIPYGKWPFARVARGEIVSKLSIKTINALGVVYREAQGYPIYDENNEFSRGIMIFRNINDRIRKEESRLLKTQEELLTKVVEALNLEFVRCSYPDLKIISINDKGLSSLKERNNGTEPIVSPIGASYFTIYTEDQDHKKESLNLYQTVEGREVYKNYTSTIVNGEKRFFKTIHQPIVGLDDEMIEIIFITIDITDEVRAKNKMEETLEMQNQIFTTISHELKTPLNVIFAGVQLIEMDLKEELCNINKEDMGKSVSMIKQNCYRFTKLINNIMDSSRMESQFYKLENRNGNIVEIVEDIVDSIRPHVENIGLYIIFDTEIEEKLMAVDIDKIERILLNLISNAAKFSYKGDTIYVDIEDKVESVLILVRDCGVGINKKHINTIFNKYKKVDNSLFRNAEGSGIGLSLVKTMVNLIGGEISVESELGKGSTFIVKLPANITNQIETTSTAEPLESSKGQLDIEFSDIYTK